MLAHTTLTTCPNCIELAARRTTPHGETYVLCTACGAITLDGDDPDDEQALERCTMNVLGTRWTICGASSDGPCMCDVVVTAARPPRQLIPCDELRQLYQTDAAAYRARLAALPDADLEWQAAIYAAYLSLNGKAVTTDEALARFRRSVAIHEARSVVREPADAACATLFELALTNPPALIEYLRTYSDLQRYRLAWCYATWLKQHHGLVYEPAYLLRGWAALLVGAAASGVA